MMNVQKTESWRIFDDLLLFSLSEEVDWWKDLVTLLWKKWEDMAYWSNISSVVSFPGEYDMWWISITCYHVSNLLHYVVQFDEWERIAILQHASVLEKKDIEWVNEWYVTDESIQSEINQLELEWDIHMLV